MFRCRAWSLLLSLALSVSGLDALRSSMSAMACCAKTHNECAGLRAPDDCCRSMGHALAPSPSVAPSPRDDASLVVVAIAPAAEPNAVIAPLEPPLVEPAVKRPHDPPHLHPT